MGQLILDTDGASDDLVALLLAIKDGGSLPLSMITTVAGAVGVEQATANVEALLGLADHQVPVAVGAAKPLARPLENAAALRAHGPSGIHGIEWPAGPSARTSDTAVSAIIKAVRSHPGDVTLVCIGPVTNLATALLVDPGLAPLFDRVIVSSGTVRAPGNVVPAADFNFWIDPEAAAIVLESEAPLTLLPWDVYVESAVLTDEELSRVRDSGSAIARSLLAANDGIAAITARITPFDSGLIIADTIAVAMAQQPDMVTDRGRYHVAVETSSRLTRGVTVVDVYGVTEEQPNVEVVLGIDRPAFIAILLEALS